MQETRNTFTRQMLEKIRQLQKENEYLKRQREIYWERNPPKVDMP